MKLREHRKKQQEREELERKQKEEKEKLEEQKIEEEKKRLQEEKERKEEEEYLKMKEGFTVEEEGFDEEGQTESQNLLQEFISHIKVYLLFTHIVKIFPQFLPTKLVISGEESSNVGGFSWNISPSYSNSYK